MQTKLANDTFREHYVAEIDGIAKSEHSVFVKALTASLQLKQEFPHRSVKLRDADDEGATNAAPRFIKMTYVRIGSRQM